jgi:hypothetical protein
MLRTALAASLMLLSAATAAPALADAAMPAANRGYTTAETPIGTLVDDAEAKAIVDKHLPGFSTNPQVEMARGFTLKQVQAFVPDQIKDEILAAIDADLAKLPPK